MDNPKLAEIIQAAMNGDKSAQAELYNAFSKSVYFTAYKLLQHKEDSEDIVNEVFLTVFQEIKKLENPASFSTWLKRITINRCKKWLARNPSAFTVDIESVDEKEFEEELDPKLLPEKSLDDTESTRMIVQIIDNLPIELRYVIYGYYYEQMTIQQLADMLALSDRAVKKRLATARQKIREEIERVEDRDGIQLHAIGLPFLPIGAILKSAYESFEVSPDSLSAIFENVTQNLSMAATATATTTTATTVSTTATAVTKGVNLMSMKAIIAIIASVVIIGGVITGVVLLSQDNNNVDNGNNNTTTTPRGNNATTQAENDSNPTQTSNNNENNNPPQEGRNYDPFDLSNYHFKYKGGTYRIGMTLEEFMAVGGFVYSDDEELDNSDMGSYESRLYFIDGVNNYYGIKIEVVNLSDDDIRFEKAIVCMIELSDPDGIDESVDMELVGGLKWGATQEDIFAVFGEPDDILDYGGYTKTIQYYPDNSVEEFRYIRLGLCTTTGGLHGVEMYNDFED